MSKEEIRPEKIEEIKTVWNNPEIKTNREKLIHLFNDCKKVEQGYTIKEFANAIFPENMIASQTEEESDRDKQITKYIERMLTSFSQDMINHRIALTSKYVEGVYVYYNAVEDTKARHDLVKGAKMHLGMEKKINQSFDTFERRNPKSNN
jgi:NADH dehydrogenase/NADH:ubiquinone oxidoreductase subunit G